MLEKMAEFFENRLDGYDEHMMTNIEAADEFYRAISCANNMVFTIC